MCYQKMSVSLGTKFLDYVDTKFADFLGTKKGKKFIDEMSVSSIRKSGQKYMLNGISGSLMFLSTEEMHDYIETVFPQMDEEYINLYDAINLEEINAKEMQGGQSDEMEFTDLSDEAFLEQALSGGNGDGEEENATPPPPNNPKTDKCERSTRSKQLEHVTRVYRSIRRYGACLPVVGYNSSKFDLPALIKDWPHVFNMLSGSEKRREMIRSNMLPLQVTKTLDNGEVRNVPVKNYQCFKSKKDIVFFDKSVIQPGKKFVHVGTPDGLVFRDLILFVAPNTSLARLGKSYNVDVSKMVFPYSVLGNLDIQSTVPSMEEGSDCYDWFQDKLKKPWHKHQSNLLESDWNQATRLHFTRKYEKHIKIQKEPDSDMMINPFGLSNDQMTRLNDLCASGKSLWQADLSFLIWTRDKTSDSKQNYIIGPGNERLH